MSDEGIGQTFNQYIYDRTRTGGNQFGEVLLDAYAEGFPEAPTASANKAHDLLDAVLGWVDGIDKPEETPDDGWGSWMIDSAADVGSEMSAELGDLLHEIDGVVESDQSLGRYLGQITPLGKDLAAAKSEGVRIMTMANAKGLTVKATIVGALEHGIVPRPDCDPREELRLLYAR